ncbi:MAG: glutathione S-transferase family protein [Betaproteobacteria bacterium]
MLINKTDIKTHEVNDWDGLYLLHFNQSSCSQKVRIVLGELGIDCQYHHINLIRNEQKSDWYRGINPAGQVPTLVHNGQVHTESNDIIQYLDDCFAPEGRSLVPRDVAKKATMHELLALEDGLHADLRIVTFTYLMPDPDNIVGETVDVGMVIGRFHNALTQLELQLNNHPYLLGDSISLLDISWGITLFRLKLAGYPLEKYPKVHSSFQKVVKRSHFKRELAKGPFPIKLLGTAYRLYRRVRGRTLRTAYLNWELAR